MRQVVLDTETTGLDARRGHRVIEIGCVELVERRLSGRQFHRYLNPQRDIDAGAQQVHGLSAEFLADKPLFANVAEELLAFIGDAELVIHNAAFDVGFLDAELDRLDAKVGCIRDYATVCDTLALARERFPGQRNSLDALCRRFEIDNAHRELHGALLDAQLLAEVYLALTAGQGTLEFSAIEPTATRPVDAGFVGSELAGSKSSDSESPPTLSATSVVRVVSADLPRVQVSDAERQAHQQRLQAIQHSAGQCLWPLDVSSSTD